MKIRAFVFDDDEQVRNVISELLKERGYEVHGFSEPGICPIYLEQRCPCLLDHTCADIIITDINMPYMTGLELIENQLRNGCKVKNIMVLSGSWTDAQVTYAKALGCKIFKKPFKIDEFFNWLDECERRLDPKRKLSDWFKHKKGITYSV